jgi:hypothetical protein
MRSPKKRKGGTQTQVMTIEDVRQQQLPQRRHLILRNTDSLQSVLPPILSENMSDIELCNVVTICKLLAPEYDELIQDACKPDNTRKNNNETRKKRLAFFRNKLKKSKNNKNKNIQEAINSPLPNTNIEDIYDLATPEQQAIFGNRETFIPLLRNYIRKHNNKELIKNLSSMNANHLKGILTPLPNNEYNNEYNNTSSFTSFNAEENNANNRQSFFSLEEEEAEGEAEPEANTLRPNNNAANAANLARNAESLFGEQAALQGDNPELIELILQENFGVIDTESILNSVLGFAANILQSMRNGLTDLNQLREQVLQYANAVLSYLRDRGVQGLNALSGAISNTSSNLRTLFLSATRLLLNNIREVVPSRRTLFIITFVLYEITQTFVSNTNNAIRFAMVSAGRLMYRAGANAARVAGNIALTTAGVAVGAVAVAAVGTAAVAERVITAAAPHVYRLGIGALDMAGSAVVATGRGVATGARVVTRLAVDATYAAAPVVRDAGIEIGHAIIELLREAATRTGNGIVSLSRSLLQLGIRAGISGAQLAAIGLQHLGRQSEVCLRLLLLALKTGSLSLLRLAIVTLNKLFELLKIAIEKLKDLGVVIAVEIANAVAEYGPIIANMLLRLTIEITKMTGRLLLNVGSAAASAGVAAARALGSAGVAAVTDILVPTISNLLRPAQNGPSNGAAGVHIRRRRGNIGMLLGNAAPYGLRPGNIYRPEPRSGGTRRKKVRKHKTFKRKRYNLKH